MNLTDPVADMLTRVRNALRARHQVVDIPHSKLKFEIARILKEEGYVRNYKVVSAGPGDTLKLLLKYDDRGSSVVRGLKRISTPGRRVYSGAEKLSKVYGGLGIAILSTSSGLMTGYAARKQGVGGEVLCHVW